MEAMTMTKVIFRKCKGEFKGDVIAFFPDTLINGKMTCYQHIGQHGEAHMLFYLDTLKATEGEYKVLYDELVFIGYDDLQVMQKMTYKR
jgi:hypothetical protein